MSICFSTVFFQVSWILPASSVYTFVEFAIVVSHDRYRLSVSFVVPSWDPPMLRNDSWIFLVVSIQLSMNCFWDCTQLSMNSFWDFINASTNSMILSIASSCLERCVFATHCCPVCCRVDLYASRRPV